MTDEFAPEDKYDRAWALADEILASAPETFGCKASQLRELDYVDLIIQSYHEIQTFRPEERRVCHKVSEKAPQLLYYSAQSDPDIYDTVKEICVRNLFSDAPLPELFRLFIIAELLGKPIAKKRIGRAPSEGFGYRAFLFLAARYVASACQMPLTRNAGSSDETSACDAIVDVGVRHGIDIEFNRLRDWCTHRDHRSMRRKAEALETYLSELFLTKQGLIRPDFL